MINISFLSIFIDISLTSIVIYIVYYFFKGTHSATIVNGLIIAISIYIISIFAQLNTITWIFMRFFNEFPIIMVIIFHQEIRQFFYNIGRTHHKNNTSQIFSRQLSSALTKLSEQQTGALILIEQNMKLNDLLNTGVMLDARFSVELLLSIFYKGTPLHDGAVIIRNEHIFATKILIPSVFHSTSVGTRHSAAISISKERDCIAFVVSEETGAISYAQEGILTPIPNILIEDIVDEIIATQI